VIAANYNCPGQIVISGAIEAVDKAIEIAKEEGCRLAKKLSVSGAFHSSLMSFAFDGLKEKLNEVDFKKPKCAIYSNYTAQPVTDPTQIKENVLKQLLNPVRWTQTMKQMKENGAEKFIEVGPGKVLQGLAKRTLKDVEIEGYV
ncbi:MAG TPA: ACP S-malonyltransferase, partial [Balneolaceae bacterium]|nr:ACP S-malonyltransferase [Balneolaceae bacterium]